MSDLDAIINGTNEAVEAVEVAPQVEEEVIAEPVVDEPQVEEPKAEAAAKEPEMVPLSALLEMRRELQDVKSRLPKAEQPKAPDVFDDPEGYQGYVGKQIEQRAVSQKLESSKFHAEREFGADVVSEAYAYFEAHPEQSQALLGHPSPFHAAVEVYNSQKVAQEIGNDPAAYAAKVKASVRAEIEAEMVAKQARDNAGKFAPSMANVTGTGGGPKTSWAGPTSLDSLIG